MVLHAQNEEKGVRRVQAIMESNPVNQKSLVTKLGVDTLKILDRIAVRTSATDWMLLMPNIGAEFDVKPVTWNRWTVGFNLRYNWQTSHTYTQGLVYNLFEARLEARQYWRARQIREGRLEAHTRFYDKVFSVRRTKVKHPMFTWYRGLYVSYDKYSFLFGSEGHQGTAVVGGVSYGFVWPMYGFRNGNSLDLEFGILGVSYVKDARFRHDRENDCYPVLEQKDWKLNPIPVVSELRVGLVYRLGRVNLLSKYRYRRDADNVYDERLTDIRTTRNHALDSIARDRKEYDSVLTKFLQVYDSIAAKDSKEQPKFDIRNLRNMKMPDELDDDADTTPTPKAAKKPKKAKKRKEEADE